MVGEGEAGGPRTVRVIRAPGLLLDPRAARPGLRRFMPDAKVLTWLRGTVPAADMNRDIDIGWKPWVPHRDRFYAWPAANSAGWGAALLVLSVTAIAVGILVRLACKRAAVCVGVAGAGLAAVAGFVVFFSLPIVAVEKPGPEAIPGSEIVALTDSIPTCLDIAIRKKSPDGAVTAEWIRAALIDGMRSDAMQEKFYYVPEASHDSFIEGDSPNQFSIREENGSAKVYFQNGIGQEFLIWQAKPGKK